MLVPRLLWMLFAANTVAGTATYSGNQFIFARFPAYPCSYEYATAHFLFIGHAREGRCTVTESNGAYHHVQLIGNNSVTQFHLPTDRMLTPGVAVEEDRAVELICTTEVTLSILQRAVSGGIADAFPVLPVQSLSTKYIVPSVPTNALLGVVAIYNNTNVTVHLNSTCSHPFRGNIYGRGSQLSITLLQGEILQIASSQSTTSNTCDLGGTVVESSHSVAVFSGAFMLCYPRWCDGAMNQVPPLEKWGTSFIVPLAPVMEQFRVRITSGYNGTNITIEAFDGVESIILNEAEIYDEDFRTTNVTYIKSSQPILVLQIISGFQSFSAIVPATDAYGTGYIIPDIQTSVMSYTRYVTIITSLHCTSHLNVNGTWTNQPTESQTFAITSFQPSVGFHVITSNSSACPFGVLVTGLGNDEMYGYFSTPVRRDSGECENGRYGDYCKSRCGRCANSQACDKSSGECPGGCQANYMEPLCKELLSDESSTWETSVIATLCTLLVLAAISILIGIICIRRLKKELTYALRNKKPEDNYISLDETTKEPVVESAYQDIGRRSHANTAGQNLN